MVNSVCCFFWQLWVIKLLRGNKAVSFRFKAITQQEWMSVRLCAKKYKSAQETSIESSMIYAYCNESARSNNVCIPMPMLVNFWNCTSWSENSVVASTAKAGAFNQSWARMWCFQFTAICWRIQSTASNICQCYSWNGCEILPGGMSWMSSKEVVSSAAEEKNMMERYIRLLIWALWKNTGQTEVSPKDSYFPDAQLQHPGQLLPQRSVQENGWEKKTKKSDSKKSMS